MKREFKNVGSIKTLSEKYFLIYDDKLGETFVCKNIDAFKETDSLKQLNQKIQFQISNVFFFGNSNVLEAIIIDDDAKKHISENIETTDDENLISLVKFCKGADVPDWKTVRNFYKVIFWEELPNIAGGLGAGLGFPGTGVSLLKVDHRIDFGESPYYLQIVHSYDEGYAVEHIQLSDELVRACNTEKIKTIFKL